MTNSGYGRRYRENRKILTIEFALANTPLPLCHLPPDNSREAYREHGAIAAGFNA
jgi:hypothetical protein